MRFLVLIMILTGCGTDSSKNSDTPVKAVMAPTTASTPGTGTPGTPVTSNVPTDAVYAVSLTSVKDLPECSAKNSKQLAYVKEDSSFYSCEPTGWSVLTIAVKGEAGAKGDPGPAGQVVTLPTNEWLDVITGVTWLIGGPVNHVSGNGACSNGWRPPTHDEGQAACAHGILAKFTVSTVLFEDDTPTTHLGACGGSSIPDFGTVYDLACVKTP
jgi:hypothetical protein